MPCPITAGDTSIVIVPTLVVPDAYGRFRMLQLPSTDCNPYVPFWFHFSQPSHDSVCRQMAAYLASVLVSVTAAQVDAGQLYAELTRPDSGSRMLTLSKMDAQTTKWPAPGAVSYHVVIRLASEVEARSVLERVAPDAPTGDAPPAVQAARKTSGSLTSANIHMTTLSSTVDVLHGEDSLGTRLAAGVLVAQADWFRTLSVFPDETSARIRSVMPVRGVWGPIVKTLHRPMAAVSSAAALGSAKFKALWQRVKNKSGYANDEVTTVVGMLEYVRYLVESMEDPSLKRQILEALLPVRRRLDSVASVSHSIAQTQS